MKPATEQLRGELGFTKAIGWVRDDIWMIIRADYIDKYPARSTKNFQPATSRR